MSPEGDRILALCMQRLASEIGPSLTTQFAAGQLGLTGFMLSMVAREYERGAELRVSENRAMRALFAELAPAVSDRELKGKLEDAAATRDDVLTISSLDVANWALRRLLIALQSHLEDQSGASAREGEARVWALLKSIAANRMVSLA
ncbi:MAG: hypothetical protein JOZ55_10860 [Alphaproteobacteria bacterium]|nr:hypothetical protein [Alphaproteobacteria bacterium]